MGATRLIVMFGVAAGVAGALMLVTLNAGESGKALLFSDLEMSEAAAITERLDQSGIAYDLRGGGSAVFVDKRRVLDARMMLSEEGLPRSGSVGYEIFDSQDALGSTRFVQNINRVRALEGELSRTIRALDGVASARVHLALPERRLFEREEGEAKASVWIELRQDDLAGRHARAIRNLVAGAVPGLKPSRVTILDGEGRLLADGSEDSAADGLSMVMEDRRAQIEERIRLRIVDLVESAVGRGKVRAEVAAEIDMSRVTESAEIYDPNGQVVRSSETIEESSSDTDKEADGAVSVSENIPETASDNDEDAGRVAEAASNRVSEIVNYEISKTTRTQVHEIGAITRLSVAVAVDGESFIAEDGSLSYVPRSAEEMQRIQALVRTAAGFNEERGDTIEVANVRFAREPAPPMGEPVATMFAFDKNDIMRGVELLVLTVVATMIIFLVARPLLRGAVAPMGGMPALAAPGAAHGGGGQAALAAPQGAPAAEGGQALPAPAPSPVDAAVDVMKIDGQVKASSIKRMAEIVDAHPDESVSILRTWLHEG